jgi:Transposase
MDGRGYASAVKKVLPQARIVAGRFHVAKAYRNCADQLRIEAQRDLKAGLNKEEYEALEGTMSLFRRDPEELDKEERERLALLFECAPDLKRAYDQREKLTGIFENEIVAASEKKMRYLGWAMYGANDTSHPIHKLNSCEQTRVWEVMTARKATILHPRLYARLCSTWGRALPVDWFILPVALKALFEAPRLRKALSLVRNKRRTFARKPSSGPKPAVPMRSASAMKRIAAVKYCAEASPSGRP